MRGLCKIVQRQSNYGRRMVSFIADEHGLWPGRVTTRRPFKIIRRQSIWDIASLTYITIEGSLQEQVERAFWEHLRDVGFRVDYELYADPTRRGLFWWRQVAWLKGGDVDAKQPVPKRAAVCKTG